MLLVLLVAVVVDEPFRDIVCVCGFDVLTDSFERLLCNTRVSWLNLLLFAIFEDSLRGSSVGDHPLKLERYREN